MIVPCVDVRQATERVQVAANARAATSGRNLPAKCQRWKLSGEAALAASGKGQVFLGANALMSSAGGSSVLLDVDATVSGAGKATVTAPIATLAGGGDWSRPPRPESRSRAARSTCPRPVSARSPARWSS